MIFTGYRALVVAIPLEWIDRSHSLLARQMFSSRDKSIVSEIPSFANHHIMDRVSARPRAKNLFKDWAGGFRCVLTWIMARNAA